MARREICHILGVCNRPIIPLPLEFIFRLSLFLYQPGLNIHFGGGSLIDGNIIDNLPRFHDGDNPAKSLVHLHH